MHSVYTCLSSAPVQSCIKTHTPPGPVHGSVCVCMCMSECVMEGWCAHLHAFLQINIASI